MAQSLSQKIVASPENPPRSCYEGNLDGCTCSKILGDFFPFSSEERSYETA